MKIEKISIGDLDCLACRPDNARKAAYILYPMDIDPAFIEAAALKHGAAIAVITGMDWDDDLTPWPAAGVPEGSPDFKGHAPEFLNALVTSVIPEIESRIGFSAAPIRTLVGVSLSGLFALWQWTQSDFFRNIATLSGSFWYDGFEPWLSEQSFADKAGRCFMLLGDAEPKSKNPTFATVGACTEAIAAHLRSQGIDVDFTMVKGNHYQYARQRLEMALEKTL